MSVRALDVDEAVRRGIAAVQYAARTPRVLVYRSDDDLPPGASALTAESGVTVDSSSSMTSGGIWDVVVLPSGTSRLSVEKLRALLEQIHDALAPGGVVVARWPTAFASDTRRPGPDDSPSHLALAAGDLLATARVAGFEFTHVQRIHREGAEQTGLRAEDSFPRWIDGVERATIAIDVVLRRPASSSLHLLRVDEGAKTHRRSSPEGRTFTWIDTRDKLSTEWGDAKAHSLWTGVYERWSPEIDGRVVLDLGCHWGYLLRYLGQRFMPLRLIGVDVKPFWERASVYAREGYGRIEFVHSENGLPGAGLSDDSVDLVLSTGTLRMMAPPVFDETLSEIWRILRPGGEFLLRTRTYMAEVDAGLQRTFAEPYLHVRVGRRLLDARLRALGRDPITEGHWYTATGYLLAFQRAGFEILDVRRKTIVSHAELQATIASEFAMSEAEARTAVISVRLRKF